MFCSVHCCSEVLKAVVTETDGYMEEQVQETSQKSSFQSGNSVTNHGVQSLRVDSHSDDLPSVEPKGY